MKQFMKFGIIGISNTFISYVIYVIALKMVERSNFKFTYDYMLCSVISFLISVLWAFYWNNRFTFKRDRSKTIWLSILKTYASYSVTGLLLNNFFLYMWVDFFQIPKETAFIPGLLATVPINYLLNKYWAFK